MSQWPKPPFKIPWGWGAVDSIWCQAKAATAEAALGRGHKQDVRRAGDGLAVVLEARQVAERAGEGEGRAGEQVPQQAVADEEQVCKPGDTGLLALGVGGGA